ncbi:MAG: YgeY family selenium metabolism-linked hydrolase [Ignavibacteriales bacterium CG07_land_8_20_14_0_80_59_12]|nr:MAG: YgeY family selenium metabolism-linked hydrolase [Ignavibacteriales bacterium CG07_land_8_20_14_0_80_59_12]
MYERIYQAAQEKRTHISRFLRDLIAIKSTSSQEEQVIHRMKEEMDRCGYDEVMIDPMGNILGRIGNGKHILALDAHVDTVDVGNPENWSVDPFKGDERDGVIYGRGACDMKGALASIVYGGRIIKELGLEGDFTLYVVGSVQEEDCDGLCWQYIINEDRLRPELVVIAEPTNLGIYRGHRGRMEIEVRTQGISCHGSAPERGVNAVYKMAPIIEEIEKLNDRLTGEPFLGKGTVTISEIRSTSPSLCAVADSATIHLDRRLAATDTMESAVKEILDLPGVREADADVVVLDYVVPSWRGLTYPTKKYYPTWLLPESHPAMASGIRTYERLFGETPQVGRWVFSTNGVAAMGMHGIPCVGFGPGNEVYAHMATEQIPVEHLVKASAWYAAFPGVYLSTSQ